MNFLILSTATGQGHNSAAVSIREYLDGQGCDSVLMDVLNSGDKDVSSHVSTIYGNMTVYFPWFFGFLYHLGEIVTSPDRHSPIYRLNAAYADPLYKIIREASPDVIVCAHIFSAQVVTRIREKYGLDIPTVGIMTDYTCSPFWEETRLDRYVIPAPELIGEFAGKGMPEEKLVPIGIPVRSRFNHPTDKKAARELFGFSDGPLVAVMSGSMGYGNLEQLVRKVTRKIPEAQVAALCGRNKKLYYRLSGIKNVRPFEYIDNVDALMDAADVLLTKPGGLSSTEALVKRVPIVLTNPIPGCEKKNSDFLCSLGAAVAADNADKAAEAALALLCDPLSARRMLDAQKAHIDGGAAAKIGELLLDLGKGVSRVDA